jgi:imidazolonepropionase
MIILKNIKEVLTLQGVHDKDGRSLASEDLNPIQDACIVYDDDAILWVGSQADTPSVYFEKKHKVIDAQSLVVTPELVDSHTHIVFGGNRAKEYAMRLNGADYEQIALNGGGIISTMRGTNSLTHDQLFDIAKTRIEKISSYGVGTIEIKSGYGLNAHKEMELSLIIDELKRYFSPKIQIFNTFMAAHAIPEGFNSSSDYIDNVVLPLLKDLSPMGIIDAVDIFHEQNYFTTSDVEKLFAFSRQLEIPVKIHADEFNDNGGASLAVKFQALSCDHLLKTNTEAINQLANSNTVATLLPGTGFFLGKEQANARQFLDAGVKVALASDYNPGSCHYDNILQIAALSAPSLRLNMAELWSSITYNAAHALGLKNQGAITAGLRPRFSFFNVNNFEEITYNWGRNYAITNIPT